MDQEYSLEYNSNREKLLMPEYGRNVQKLVRHAKSIEDAKERQAFIETVINMMQQMHPQNRNLEDYRDRLWRHVFHIAEYDLEVDTPSGEVPLPENAFKKPDTVPYPKSQAKFRHYGDNVQRLIDKALAMEDGPKKTGLVHAIGSYMKLAYRTWNQEHFVSDDIIKNDLESLAGGKLSIDESQPIENIGGGSGRRRSSSRDNNSRGRSRDNNRGRSYKGGGRKRK